MVKVQALTPVQPPIVNDGAVVLSMIDKIIAQPDVPVEKIEQLFNLHQRIQADAARREFDSAFAAMQPDLPVIERNGTIKTNEKDGAGNKTGKQVDQNKYALFEDIMETIRPQLAVHGFGVSFKTSQPTADRVAVTCILSHRGGHREETTFALPIDSSGSKNNVQGWGSAVSYAKRYTATALLNIISRGDDDDGKAAGAAPAVESDLKAVKRLIEETNSPVGDVCAFFSVETLDDLSAKQVEHARRLFEKKKVKSP